jgi:hypothetical protein
MTEPEQIQLTDQETGEKITAWRCNCDLPPDDDMALFKALADDPPVQAGDLMLIHRGCVISTDA